MWRQRQADYKSNFLLVSWLAWLAYGNACGFAFHWSMKWFHSGQANLTEQHAQMWHNHFVIMLQWFGMDKMPVLRDRQTNIEAYSRYPCTREATVLNSVRKRLMHTEYWHSEATLSSSNQRRPQQQMAPGCQSPGRGRAPPGSHDYGSIELNMSLSSDDTLSLIHCP